MAAVRFASTRTPGDLKSLKPGTLDSQIIQSEIDSIKAINAGFVGVSSKAYAGPFSGYPHMGAGNDRAGGVQHGACNCTAAGLGTGYTRERQKCRCEPAIQASHPN